MFKVGDLVRVKLRYVERPRVDVGVVSSVCCGFLRVTYVLYDGRKREASVPLNKVTELYRRSGTIAIKIT